ncbi:hypothetical protein GH810_02070 [Acetobacterium paludosum]|uniref:TOTE conflict system primase domain-containing protein n=1 Tax=Acetobacterium paludosum TaxID=52693 RepID=A0A923HW93_9FIRM|nr:hypothetical protein [Acetobacterium paludosum]MBC3887096.1 hypothetical protein [Acetobacterium paludosum]
MKYAELLKKYEALLRENKNLKETIEELNSKITEESTVKCIVKETVNLINDKDKTSITKKSSTQEKLDIFLSIFRGRTDVCAKRWRNKPGYSPYCFNDFKPGICNKPRTKCTECKQSNFAPLDRKQLEKHLLGNEVIGLYPLTIKDTCCLLAIDFDKSTWREDIAVIRRVCRKHDIPMYVERSRSGEGAHLWFFFENEIKYLDDYVVYIDSISESQELRKIWNDYSKKYPYAENIEFDQIIETIWDLLASFTN